MPKLVGDGHHGPAIIQVQHDGGQNPGGLAGDTGNFALNAAEQADANAASAKFIGFLNNPHQTRTPVSIYDPHDQAARSRLKQNLRLAMAGTRDPASMSPAQLARVAAALQPYVRFAEVASAQSSGKGVVVPAGGVVRLTEQGYCLDHTFPAPGGGEQFRLAPVSNLLPREFLPIYQGLVQAGGQNGGASPQGALWFLRGVAQGTAGHPLRIDQGLAAQLEQASPGASQVLKHYDSEKFPIGLLNLNIAPTTYNLFGGSPAERRAAVQATLGTLVAQSTPAPQSLNSYNPGFSTLSPGVVAHAYGGGFQATIDVVNTTTAPTVFDPEQYVAQAARRVQRLALSGRPSGIAILGGVAPPLTSSDMATFSSDLLPIIGNGRALAQVIFDRFSALSGPAAAFLVAGDIYFGSTAGAPGDQLFPDSVSPPQTVANAVPPPVDADGKPLPPPTSLPNGKNGEPNRWVQGSVSGTGDRGARWKPEYTVPSNKGEQPSASWDSEEGHWDIDDGRGKRTRYLPDGTPVVHR